jgi:hypothetical protein
MIHLGFFPFLLISIVSEAVRFQRKEDSQEGGKGDENHTPRFVGFQMNLCI